MQLDPLIQKKFAELIAQGEAVVATHFHLSGGLVEDGGVLHNQERGDYVDGAKANAWFASCLSFFARVLGKESDYYRSIYDKAQFPTYYTASKGAVAVVRAASQDFDQGYLFETRRVITAEVFDGFLEQAEYMLSCGYFQVCVVIAGCVLEDGLRKLMKRRGLTVPDKPKLDLMNADLVKAGAYTVLTQKKITWLADLRNKAAHGKWDTFTQADATDMVTGVRRFLEDFIA